MTRISTTPSEPTQPSGVGSTDALDITAYVSALALAIDHFGLIAFSTAVADLADRARDIAPVAARVLEDPAQPLAARERAFARVSLVLTRAATGTWTPEDEATA
jgi:hypothetical protein